MATADVKKKGAEMGSGSADIVALASDRLSAVAGAMQKEGMTEPVKAELSAIMALLETVVGLYDVAPVEGAPAEGDVEMADEGDDATEKSMTPGEFLCHAASEITAIQAETDPVKKAFRRQVLESALKKAQSFEQSGGAALKIPMYRDPMRKPDPTSGPPPSPPSGGGQYAGNKQSPSGPVQTDVAGGNFVSKMADVKKKLAGLTSAAPTPAPNEEQVRKVSPAWSSEYVRDLPDGCFLYIEANAQKDLAGRSQSSHRHWPVKDAEGKLDVRKIADAIEQIPMSGFPKEVKESLLKQAQKLLTQAEVTKGLMQDEEGWPLDLADPAFMKKKGAPLPKL